MSEKETEIERKLDVISRLLAFNIVRDKSVKEQVDILTKAGLKAQDIATILDKSDHHIHVTQNLLRKKKKEDLDKAAKDAAENSSENTTNDISGGPEIH